MMEVVMNTLHSIENIFDFAIAAKDGDIGRIKDVYFDDHEWTIRHLVVDTGGWLTGRKVLVPPNAVMKIGRGEKKAFVDLTRQQVQNSPDIDTDVPVGRQHEKVLSDYYGYPYYWNGPYLWGYAVLPGLIEPGIDRSLWEDPERQALERKEHERANANPHLRSGKEVIGYDIHAVDDTFGHVEDLLFDEDNWKIELLAVDTRDWWPGKSVMISPDCIDRISWDDKSIVVKVTREQVEHSPEYDPDRPPPAGGASHEVFRRSV
jgi:uncharacterized protein YrrD